MSDPVQQPWPPQATSDPAQPYQAPPQQSGSNGFAVAGLIFGIIGGSILGLIFGILGLVRAKKVNRGKVMSWIAIILSIIWLAIEVFIVAAVVSRLAKATDPGCTAYQAVTTQYSEAKLTADAANPTALMADFNAIASGLKDAAAKAKSAEARTAIQTEADHIQALIDAINGGKLPDPGFEAQLDADDKAVADACGFVLAN